jgi:hypothetical protein
VSTFDKLLIVTIVGTLAPAPLTFAQDDAADLTAVIALQGKPCGRVVNVAKRGENDFIATCQDGNRYHVFVRDGRVVVEEA